MTWEELLGAEKKARVKSILQDYGLNLNELPQNRPESCNMFQHFKITQVLNNYDGLRLISRLRAERLNIRLRRKNLPVRGQIDPRKVGTAQREQGWSFNDLKKAVKLHNL